MSPHEQQLLDQKIAVLQQQIDEMRSLQFPLDPHNRRVVNRDLVVYKRESGASRTVEINDRESTWDMIPSQTGNSGKYLTTDGTTASWGTVSTSVTRYLLYRVLSPSTSVSVATTVGGDLEIPVAGTLSAIGAYVDTAGTTGTMTVDVNKNGTTLMSATKITIDTTEKSSRTAATPPVLTTTSLAVGDLITVDVDAIHTTPAVGLTIYLVFS